MREETRRHSNAIALDPSWLQAGAGILVVAAIVWLVPFTRRPRHVTHVPPQLAAVDPAVPAADAPTPVAFQAVQQFRLGNGLRVVVIEDHRLPQMRCTMTIGAGRVYQPAAGIADATADLLVKRTADRSETALTQDVEQMGATLSESVLQEQMQVGISGLSEHTPRILSLLSDVVQRPSFTAGGIERLQREWGSADVRTNAPRRVIDRMTGASLFGPGMDDVDVSATAEDLVSITSADLLRFYDNFYRPDNAVLAIGGDVAPAEIRGQIAHLFGGWQSGHRSIRAPDVSEWTRILAYAPPNRVRIHIADWRYETTATISFRCLTPPEGSADEAAFGVATQILSEVGAGRLDEELRDEAGYTYGTVSTTASIVGMPGIWGTSVHVPLGDVDSTIRDTEAEFARLRDDPVPPVELERAKRAIVGQNSWAGDYMDFELASTVFWLRSVLPADYGVTLQQHTLAVTAADVRRAARAYMTTGDVQVFVVGPAERLAPTLDRYGDVQFYTDSGHFAG
jgi:zinc protease